MPYLVNGQVVPEQVILEESGRISRDARWGAIQEDAERTRKLRAAAESSATDRILLEQLAMSDPRTIDSKLLEQHVEQMKVQTGCRGGFDDALARQFLERQLRVQRLRSELVADVPSPTEEELESFYRAHRENFQQPELFHAAHIVKYINRSQSEDAASAGIRLALVELQRGRAFSEVADAHSDCNDKGGDLGEFPQGYMVEEFERAIAGLADGERTDVFRTPFGLHIALLVEKKPATTASFERVRVDIERVTTFARQHEVYVNKVEELRSRADIQWVPERQASERTMASA